MLISSQHIVDLGKLDLILVNMQQQLYPELKNFKEILFEKYNHINIQNIKLEHFSNFIQQNRDKQTLIITVVFTKNFSQTNLIVLKSIEKEKLKIVTYPHPINDQLLNAKQKNDLLQIIDKFGFPKQSNSILKKKSNKMLQAKINNKNLKKVTYFHFGFKVFKSKDQQFNQNMNKIYFKYKTNPILQFNQITKAQQVLANINEKQFLVVNQKDLEKFTPQIQMLAPIRDKLILIVFDADNRISQRQKKFNLCARKIEQILSQIQFQLQLLNNKNSDRVIQEYFGNKSSLMEKKLSNSCNSNSPTSNRIRLNSAKKYETKEQKSQIQSTIFVYVTDLIDPQFQKVFKDLFDEAKKIKEINSEHDRSNVIMLADYKDRKKIIDATRNFKKLKIILFGLQISPDPIIKNSLINLVTSQKQQLKKYFELNKVNLKKSKENIQSTNKSIFKQKSQQKSSIKQLQQIHKSIQTQHSYLSSPIQILISEPMQQYFAEKVPQYIWQVNRLSKTDQFKIFLSNQDNIIKNQNVNNNFHRTNSNITYRKSNNTQKQNQLIIQNQLKKSNFINPKCITKQEINSPIMRWVITHQKKGVFQIKSCHQFNHKLQEPLFQQYHLKGKSEQDINEQIHPHKIFNHLITVQNKQVSYESSEVRYLIQHDNMIEQPIKKSSKFKKSSTVEHQINKFNEQEHHKQSKFKQQKQKQISKLPMPPKLQGNKQFEFQEKDSNYQQLINNIQNIKQQKIITGDSDHEEIIQNHNNNKLDMQQTKNEHNNSIDKKQRIININKTLEMNEMMNNLIKKNKDNINNVTIDDQKFTIHFQFTINLFDKNKDNNNIQNKDLKQNLIDEKNGYYEVGKPVVQVDHFSNKAYITNKMNISRKSNRLNVIQNKQSPHEKFQQKEIILIQNQRSNSKSNLSPLKKSEKKVSGSEHHKSKPAANQQYQIGVKNQIDRHKIKKDKEKIIYQDPIYQSVKHDSGKRIHHSTNKKLLQFQKKIELVKLSRRKTSNDQFDPNEPQFKKSNSNNKLMVQSKRSSSKKQVSQNNNNQMENEYQLKLQKKIMKDSKDLKLSKSTTIVQIIFKKMNPLLQQLILYFTDYKLFKFLSMNQLLLTSKKLESNQIVLLITDQVPQIFEIFKEYPYFLCFIIGKAKLKTSQNQSKNNKIKYVFQENKNILIKQITQSINKLKTLKNAKAKGYIPTYRQQQKFIIMYNEQQKDVQQAIQKIFPNKYQFLSYVDYNQLKVKLSQYIYSNIIVILNYKELKNFNEIKNINSYALRKIIVYEKNYKITFPKYQLDVSIASSLPQLLMIIKKITTI